MTQIPIIDGNGKLPQYNNNNFRLLYDRTINNGLMVNNQYTDPVIDHNTGDFNTMYDPLGIDKQKEIFEDNSDPTEQQYTEYQHLQFILDKARVLAPMTEEEKRLSQNGDVPLDPRIRNLIVEESVKSGSNMFALKSQDFVDEIQRSNQTYLRDKQMFSIPTDNDFQTAYAHILQEQLKSSQTAKKTKSSKTEKN